MAHGSPSKIYELPWMTSVCCFACGICNSDMLCGAHTVPFNAIVSSGRAALRVTKESKQTPRSRRIPGGSSCCCDTFGLLRSVPGILQSISRFWASESGRCRSAICKQPRTPFSSLYNGEEGAKPVTETSVAQGWGTSG